MWNEAGLASANHFALAGDADSSQDVVTSTHDIADASLVQFGDDAGGAGFQFVLKYNKTQELEVAFSLSPGELLNLHPAQLALVFGGAGNHSVALVSVIVQVIIIVRWNWRKT